MKKKEIICKTCKYYNGECTHDRNKQIIIVGRVETEVKYKEKADKVKCDVWTNA